MPKYIIKIKNSATKELEKLQENDFRKISQLIFSLAENPRPSGYKKLKDFKIEKKDAGRHSVYRVRHGKYRIIYTIEDDILEVYVAKIGHRKEVYN